MNRTRPSKLSRFLRRKGFIVTDTTRTLYAIHHDGRIAIAFKVDDPHLMRHVRQHASPQTYVFLRVEKGWREFKIRNQGLVASKALLK